MSVGFSIGSILFSTGALMAVTSRGPANGSFALGAVFFTSATFVQWRDAVHHCAVDRLRCVHLASDQVTVVRHLRHLGIHRVTVTGRYECHGERR
jgi:hypothetical protein